MFCKNDALKKFGKIHRKQLCHGLFFNKVAVLNWQLYLKKDYSTGAFLWRTKFYVPQNSFSNNFIKFLGNSLRQIPFILQLKNYRLVNSAQRTFFINMTRISLNKSGRWLALKLAWKLIFPVVKKQLPLGVL